jgi:hypothetical protein
MITGSILSHVHDLRDRHPVTVAYVTGMATSSQKGLNCSASAKPLCILTPSDW